jgi:hypothetical protein
VLDAEDEALVLTSTAASSSWSATGGPGRSILHYFYRDEDLYGMQIVPFSGNSVISVQLYGPDGSGGSESLPQSKEVKGSDGTRKYHPPLDRRLHRTIVSAATHFLRSGRERG